MQLRPTAMRVMLRVAGAGAWLMAGLCTAALMAQGPAAPMTVLFGPQGTVPITQRLASRTLSGTIVEVSCFRSMGAATAASADQVVCAKSALAKGGMLGILTDGEGMYQLAGSLTASNFSKLAPYLGKQVDVAGSEVYVSNNFSYRVFETLKITPTKK
jgi:hypothetical protein